MTPNVGTIDRIFRLVMGAILVLAPFLSGWAVYQNGTATIFSVIVGLVILGTAATKFCLVYRLLGIRTCPR